MSNGEEQLQTQSEKGQIADRVAGENATFYEGP